jgi:hypothetical protein
MQPAGRLFQHFVADVLAQRIVDLLEAVQVEQADGQRIVFFARGILPARSGRSAQCGWAGRSARRGCSATKSAA